MAIDARDAAEFYATQLGRMTTTLLRQKLLGLWPDCTGMAILGLGYTGPYLQLWREQAQRAIAVSPQQLGTSPWPLGRASLACTAEEDALPFADLSFDRILLVHGLEQADNARRTLREVWRLLKDDGRLIVVAPNRRGMWAYAESTPFGHGQPYSEGQLARLLTGLFFKVEQQQATLFIPPSTGAPSCAASTSGNKPATPSPHNSPASPSPKPPKTSTASSPPAAAPPAAGCWWMRGDRK